MSHQLCILLINSDYHYGCEILGLEHANSCECMSSVHHLFLKRTLHVRKSTPTEAVMCELGQMPLHLHLFRHKLLLRFVGQVADLPGNRVVKKAFMQAQQSCTPWSQKMSSWLHDNGLQGLLSDSTFSFSTALTSLRDTWVRQVFQSTSTQLQYLLTLCILTQTKWPHIYRLDPPLLCFLSSSSD